jgi:hypothetical protein
MNEKAAYKLRAVKMKKITRLRGRLVVFVVYINKIIFDIDSLMYEHKQLRKKVEKNA